MSNGHIVHTSDASFAEDVLKADKPVLLDFWAEWCGPCKMIAPILDEIAEEYQDRLRIAKLNIDENPQTPPKFGIRGIPTLILFKNGTVEAQKVGAFQIAARDISGSTPVRGYLGNQGRNRPNKGQQRSRRHGAARWQSRQRPPRRTHDAGLRAAGRRRRRDHQSGRAGALAQLDEPHRAEGQADPRAGEDGRVDGPGEPGPLAQAGHHLLDPQGARAQRRGHLRRWCARDPAGRLRLPALRRRLVPGRPDDIYVSPSQIRRFNLRTGDIGLRA